MKTKIVFIVLLLSQFLFSQGEADNWYFGKNVGVKFNQDGSVTALNDGQLVGVEGCATISNAAGQLLFYTEGVTIYNKNHQIMLNGTGLLGNISTTQAAIIVQMPGSAHIFYVFTLGSSSDNDLRYSIVDMSLDGGNGAVTLQKNVLVQSYLIEKLAVVNHSNNIDCWIICCDVSNTYCYLLTASGLIFTPVVSPSNSMAFNTNNNAGYMKVSPNGKKVAMCYAVNSFDINSLLYSGLELFDFDNTTGQLSNYQMLAIKQDSFYGVEFSPNSEVLYASTLNKKKIFQYDLTASNIQNSEIVVFEYPIYRLKIPSGLQLGVNNKIYVIHDESNYLGVINNPNTLGLGCNYQSDGVLLSSIAKGFGLPAFNTSYFLTPSIQFGNTCEGNAVNFNFSVNKPILSANWDFGDGNTSTTISPTHTYVTPGNFSVSVTIVTSHGTNTYNRNVTIYPSPVLINNPATLYQCDDDNDGFSFFNLKEAENTFVANTTGLTFTYFNNFAAAQNNTTNAIITNSSSYVNHVINNDIVYVRLENENGCYSIGQLNLNVSTTSIPSSFQKIFTACDDLLSGSNTDGIATFNFSSVTADIQALFPAGQLLDIKYYKNQSDALFQQNTISDISNYTNINYPITQNIYVRVNSQLNNNCLGLGHHVTLNVKRVPEINTSAIELICSNNPNFIKTIDAGLNDISTINDFTYQWFLDGNILTGETNYSLTVNTEGSYTVVVTNAQNCSNTRVITVKVSNVATIENINFTDLSENNSVIVNVNGIGDYEYSLDGENYQSSNTFYNVESGIYTVYVMDTIGCGIVEAAINLLGIPNFFTPNGDGYNDYWNIKGVSSAFNAKTFIHIFDRYGKFLKQILPLSLGWDGTCNGKIMPSSDYWYVINLEDGRKVKGHFTLKR
jgi:gliding motility-associated-like protein